ncbi:MAG: hypothetical protein IJE97_03025 [Thermoguttaceae bacterium]|nr:hypothetical protein [Thermoguttaceae bacterium]
MNVTKKLRETAFSAWTCVKRNGSKFASKGAACAAVVGSCAYGVSAMAQETTTGWPTADTVLSGLQDKLGPWVTVALTIGGTVLALKLGWGYARSFLHRT